ncbi:MAG: pyrroline-5-carboxylate reductase [Pseudomonadota bacterium]
MTHLAFIGGGSMAEAIIAGLVDSGTDPESVIIAEPVDARRAELERRYPGCRCSASSALVAGQAAQLVLAVKPQVMRDVCADISTAVQGTRPLLISVAAGIRTGAIADWVGGEPGIVRAMPNQPALLRKGVTGVFANSHCSPEDRQRATEILSAVGDVVEVEDESLIDAVTAVSGSGPAYVYLLIQMMTDTGIELGLDASMSRELAIQTATGASALAASSDLPMADLIARVRSPGGTTAAALDQLEAEDVRAIFARALTAARDRAGELADQAELNK